jgi:hypothetical protein
MDLKEIRCVVVRINLAQDWIQWWAVMTRSSRIASGTLRRGNDRNNLGRNQGSFRTKYGKYLVLEEEIP